MPIQTIALTNLPTSQEEWPSIVLVAALSGLAALARMFSGKDPLSPRYVVGGVLTSILVGVGAFAAAVSSVGVLNGWVTVIIGVVCGLFTDIILKWARKKVQTQLQLNSKDDPKDRGEP